jgi:hypothetical protein
VQAVEAPHGWDELRKDVYPGSLRPFVRYLVDEVQHEFVVSCLLCETPPAPPRAHRKLM